MSKNDIDSIITAIELHDVETIRKCFNSGIDPNMHYNDAPLILELTSEYARTPRFSNCVGVFSEHGLIMKDSTLLSILLNDAEALRQAIDANPSLVFQKYTLRCAYTPLNDVTLLHICAEFNLVACAEILIKYGADVNAKAGMDENGFGGQSPIYHTVNQNSNNSAEMMTLLLSHKANLTETVKGLIWGKSYPWETFIPAVNPISYAMMGLLPQMHRSEKTIASVVTQLLQHAFGINYSPTNVPNKYLTQ